MEHHRRIVERTFGWLNWQQRLIPRYDWRESHYTGFLHLGCALIYWNYLAKL